MGDEPSISVVIPAYNAEREIARAISSALDQTLQPTEIIVVDDGSKDRTVELARALHPSVKVLEQTNQGPGQARNAGARIASGEWLAFLDADDAWLPRKLEKQWPLTRDRRVGLVNCRAKNKQGERLGDEVSFESLWNRNDLITSSSLVRRAAFAQAGGFWNARYCEDYHLWLRLASRGWKIANCAEDLVVYSPAAGSLSQHTERFAMAEVACISDLASQLGISGARLRRRLIAAYSRHARGAIHDRDLKLARTFLRKSLSLGVSREQLWILAIASMPASLLDLRRQWQGG